MTINDGPMASYQSCREYQVMALRELRRRLRLTTGKSSRLVLLTQIAQHQESAAELCRAIARCSQYC